jgi:hypothetical protein
VAQNPSGDDISSSKAPYVDLDGDQHFNGQSLWLEGSFLRLGAPDIVTIASGVATATKGFTALAAESGTSDQLDTLTVAGVVDGDLIVLIADVGDTITVDDANINLGAATRAVGPGGCLILRYDGAETQWTEVVFLAGADNA